MTRAHIIGLLLAGSFSGPALAQPVDGTRCSGPSCPLNTLLEDVEEVAEASGLCSLPPDSDLEAKFRSGGKLTQAEFIDFITPYAQRSEQVTGIPASVTIAQAALETGWGASAKRVSNNLFGIKGRGNAGSVKLWTREYVRGRWVKVQAGFAAYHSYGDSVIAHGRLISEKRLYRNAMRYTHDPNEFARQLKRAGYATDPNYASKLISIMRKHDLYQFDGTRGCT